MGNTRWFRALAALALVALCTLPGAGTATAADALAGGSRPSGSTPGPPSAAAGPTSDLRSSAAGSPSGSPSAAVRPVPGVVVGRFEAPEHPYAAGRRGVALQADPGQPVRAALPGVVRFAGPVAGRGWVTLAHGAGLETTYGWLDERDVARGQWVRAGQRLGTLDPEAPSLHWGARLHGVYVDPLPLLGRWRLRLVPP